MRGRAAAALTCALVGIGGAGVELATVDGLLASKARIAARSVPLYVPSPVAARALSVGHASTMADLLFLWAIQHFSEPATDPADRRRWLERVYGTITDLDPKFRDAYWLGYISLMFEGQSPQAAYALVDKALAHDPTNLLLAIDAAMSARRQHFEPLAVKYLEVAAATGDSLAIRLLTRLRAAETAQQERDAWAELLDDPDGVTRAVARRHVDDLTMLVTSSQLSAVVQCYARDHAGHLPGSLAQLVAAGYVSAVPDDPQGRPYAYDARTGAVTPTTPYFHRPPSNSVRGVDFAPLGRCDPARAQP